jgi:hypothetical protein
VNPSPFGSDHVMADQQPLSPAEAQAYLQVAIDKMRDALQRALDALQRADADTIDWDYLGGQFIVVLQNADHSIDQAEDQIEAKKKREAPVTPLIGGIARDPFLPGPINHQPEGGEA